MPYRVPVTLLQALMAFTITHEALLQWSRTWQALLRGRVTTTWMETNQRLLWSTVSALWEATSSNERNTTSGTRCSALFATAFSNVTKANRKQPQRSSYSCLVLKLNVKPSIQRSDGHFEWSIQDERDPLCLQQRMRMNANAGWKPSKLPPP